MREKTEDEDHWEDECVDEDFEDPEDLGEVEETSWDEVIEGEK